MSEQRDPNRDQPLPTPGNINVLAVLRNALEEREQYGRRKYGRPLETNNGRDALTDAWEEALDLLAYLTQTRLERGDAMPGVTYQDRPQQPPEVVSVERLTKPVVRCSTCGQPHHWNINQLTDALQRQGWILTALRALTDTPSPMVPTSLVRRTIEGDLGTVAKEINRPDHN